MAMMVLDVRFKDYENGGMKAFATVTVGDDGEGGNALTIDGFRVMTGKNGLFVASPSEKGKDGEWRDKVWVPKDNGFKSEFQEQVLALYKQHLDGPVATSEQTTATSERKIPGRGNRRVGPPPVNVGNRPA